MTVLPLADADHDRPPLDSVLTATQALLWVRDAHDVRQVASELVVSLGASLVDAADDAGTAIPLDLSFDEGAPLLPTAPYGSPSRALLERHLPRFVADARRALELARRTDRLVEEATIDVLTGLVNRRMLGRSLGRLTVDDVVIMIDLDDFKLINDELGHAVGDEVLREFGRVLRASSRGRDIVGRFGGEEFVVVLQPPAGAEEFLTRLRAEWTRRRPHEITFSAGIARAGAAPSGTLERADDALYRAKDAGRDQWCWADDDGGDRCVGSPIENGRQQ